MSKFDFNVKELFSSYMKVVGVTELEVEETDNRNLYGKRLGIINGSTWIQLWSYYFGSIYLPGVKLVNVGNEAVQYNFMQAHEEGRPTPPRKNIDLFAQYARHLIELYDVDALIITCSTMNRSFPTVLAAVEEYNVPVVQIDSPMMEKAVENGGKVLIVATHGPTVDSTRKLIEETSVKLGKESSLSYTGATTEEAFHLLGQGRIDEHNELIAEAIRAKVKTENIDQVVLAQLSMSIFKLSYPKPVEEFGVPVLTSGEEGFKRVRDIFEGKV